MFACNFAVERKLRRRARTFCGKAAATMRVHALAAGVLAASSPGIAHAALTISSGKTKHVTCNAGTCVPTAAKAVLNVSQLEKMLASSNVDISTGALGATVSDIDVEAAITWTSANGLTLDAYNSLNIDKSVSVAGTGPVTLTHNDGGTSGHIAFGARGNVNFLGLGNSLTIDGHAFTLVANIATLAGDITGNPSGNYALAASYNARPDGTYTGPPLPLFSGNFNGLGNTISHLTVDNAAGGNAALFAGVTPSGAVKHLVMTDLKITAGPSSLVGSVIAQNAGAMFGDFVTGKIVAGKSGSSSTLAGGLVGQNAATGIISNCSADVKISAGDGGQQALTAVGGLVGWNSGSIFESWAEGWVTAGNASEAGGLVGQNAGGSVANAYATSGVASGNNTAAGGLIGSSNPGSYAAVYATGAVSAGTSSLTGGVVGSDFGNDDFNDAYWDLTTSGISNPSQGAGNVPNDPGITGLTTAQLQAGLPAGFSNTIWGETRKINHGLPYLLAVPSTR